MITFEQVSKRYGGRLALDSVSWHMDEGERVPGGAFGGGEAARGDRARDRESAGGGAGRRAYRGAREGERGRGAPAAARDPQRGRRDPARDHARGGGGGGSGARAAAGGRQ